ncbi:MAG: DUF1963 domain-containing protein [Phycisphaeraceae bacterium]|nr:MAG: DUF1963 domain-containing protein [Phycisphaeraceae bacterium]
MESLRDRIESTASKSVRLSHASPRSSDATRSFLGGPAAAPRSSSIPLGRDGPLSLLATIYLSEVPTTDAPRSLPEKGILQVWLDAAREAEEPSFGHSQEYLCVRYHKRESTPLIERESRNPREVPGVFPRGLRHFRRCTLRCSPALSFPVPSTLPLDHETEARYEALLQDIRPRVNHQMLGYSTPLQTTHLQRQAMCEERLRGISPSSRSRRAAKARERARLNADNWVLLLQLDSDRKAGWMWGDAGMLYLFIERSALRSQDFSNVQHVIECC